MNKTSEIKRIVLELKRVNTIINNIEKQNWLSLPEQVTGEHYSS